MRRNFWKIMNLKRGEGKPKRVVVVSVCLVVACLLSVCAGAFLCASEKKKASASVNPLQQEIAGKILRFHVRANSDSDEDQAVKLAVRDAVGIWMRENLEESDTDLDSMKAFVHAHLEDINAVAEEALEAGGFSYGASSTIKRVYFPEKTYGPYTFPEGEYEALQIVLGEGTGHNWWCVLYPNLCFRGSVYEIDEEEGREVLREVLDAEEYADIVDAGHLVFRWKFLEFLKAKR